MAPTQPEVLVVSKPLVPPWDDGGKTLVRELVAHSRAVRYRVPVTAGADVPWNQAEPWPVYGRGVGYSPGFAAKLKVFLKLMYTRGADIRHFFFAPNRISSLGCKMATLFRTGSTVQTVCSAPRSFDDAAPLLFGRKVVVLSEHTRSGLVNAGVDEQRLVLIPPGVTLPDMPDAGRLELTRKRHGLGDDLTVLYPGDYDFSRAARTALEAALQVCSRMQNTRFIFACRIKNENSTDEEQRLKARVAHANLSHRITFMNFIDDFLELLAAVDLCVLPAESVYAKVDLPLTLLEAMARKTPVVVADAGPLPEILKDDVGAKVPPSDPGALAETIERLLGDPARMRVMSETARTVVQDHFSARQMASKHETLYAQLSEGRK